MGSKEPGTKQYGLIIPKKNTTEVKRPTVFNDDSDSGGSDAGTSDWIKKSYQKQAASSSGIRRQTKIDMQRALQQDSTVYQYDEVYDELQKKKTEEAKVTKDEKKKPRYIQSLLLKAQKRKIENERRIEREVQKEREAEGEQFKDKETFVTSAYKKKLEEFNKLDEEERRQDMLEEICDVSKQQDLGGFYRHLYRSTVDNEKANDKSKTEVSSKKDEDEKLTKSKENPSPQKASTKEKSFEKTGRQYRKRKSSESSSPDEGEIVDDSDSDNSSSSDSSSSSGSSKSSNKSEKKRKSSESLKKSKPEKTPVSVEKGSKKEEEEKEKVVKSKSDDNVSKINEESTSQGKENVEIHKPKVDPVPKINIWEKRTVGIVFDEALKRYFERKSLKQGRPGN